MRVRLTGVGVRTASLLAIATAAAVLAMPAAEARALSCALPERPYSEIADVVFDGVLLSGPREQPRGRLASPARMQVVRYLKGRGPSVVRVGTDVPLLEPGDDPGVFSHTPGLFEPYPGEIYRVYGDTPKGAGSSTSRGVLTPHPCGGTFGRRTGTFLRGVRGSRAALRDSGGRRWAAELLRGPGLLRCLRVHPGLEHDEIECERPRRRSDLIAALVPAGGDTWATALAVRGADLESIAVDGPLGRTEAPATGTGHVALVVLPGYAESADLSVTARLSGGREVPVTGFGGGLLLADPHRGELLWGVARTPSHPLAPGIDCMTFSARPDTSRRGGVFSTPRHGECGPAAGFFAVRHVDRYDDEERRQPYATIVFGIAPAGTERVTVTGPDGERQAAGPTAGGSFAAIYAGDVDHAGLTVAFHRAGGAREEVRGERDWNVVPPPRSSLDTRR